jgi:HlyD family secretion protein
MNKKTLMIGGLVILVTAGVLLATGTVKLGTAKAENFQLSTVTTIQKADFVDATGDFKVHPYAELAWSTSGTVAEIKVKEGDHVKANDELMSLQTTSVSSSIISAKAQLIDAQKSLDDLMNSDTARAQAWIALRDAETSLQNAQDYRDSLNSEIKGQRVKIVTIHTPIGQRQIPKIVNYKYKADAESIAKADADLALDKAKYNDALREYNRLKGGPNQDDLSAAQAKVDAAQSIVNSMKVLAPFDGEVLYVKSTAGDVVNTGTQALILADTQHYSVDALVDEADIAKIKVDQTVEVTSDGMPDVKLTGKVTTINPVGQNVNGIIKFTVKIALDPSESRILLGSTANVTVQVSDVTSRLLVPLSAIQNDASGEFVEVQTGSSVQKVAVVTGDIEGDNVVVTGSLHVGDQIVITNSSSLKIPAMTANK